MSSLKAQAEALGIKVHGNWSDDTLRSKIEEAKQAQTGNEGVETLEPAEGPSKEAQTGAPMSDDGKKLQTEATPKAVKSKVVLDEHTMLVAKALELLIEVDEDWDDARLRSEIQQAREGRADLQVKGAIPDAAMSDPNYDAATKKDKEPEIPITLEADYWDSEETRIPAGTNRNMRKSEATRLINEGKAKRNDPLPGE